MITKGGRDVKTACFTLEGLSSFATSLNFYYLYFFMRDRFGFDNKDNLAFAALERSHLHHSPPGRPGGLPSATAISPRSKSGSA